MGEWGKNTIIWDIFSHPNYCSKCLRLLMWGTIVFYISSWILTSKFQRSWCQPSSSYSPKFFCVVSVAIFWLCNVQSQKRFGKLIMRMLKIQIACLQWSTGDGKDSVIPRGSVGTAGIAARGVGVCLASHSYVLQAKRRDSGWTIPTSENSSWKKKKAEGPKHWRCWDYIFFSLFCLFGLKVLYRIPLRALRGRALGNFWNREVWTKLFIGISISHQRQIEGWSYIEDVFSYPSHFLLVPSSPSRALTALCLPWWKLLWRGMKWRWQRVPCAPRACCAFLFQPGAEQSWAPLNQPFP